MKAVRFHAVGTPDMLVIDEIDRPVAGAGEVLVQVVSAGINFADTVRRRGDHYPVPTPLPFIPGGEVIGKVVGIGEGVVDLASGDMVFGNPGVGGCAEYVVVAAKRTFPLPAGLDPATGMALMIQGLTAALTLRRSARLRAGESVFVQGAAGGVGLLAMQIARADGAGLVIGGAGTPERRALAERHGAHLTVDYNAPGWIEQVIQATGGRGVDVILEMSGGAIFSQSLECLAPFGRSIIYGNASGQTVPTVPQRLIGKNQSLSGFYLGGFMTDRALIVETLADLAQQVMDGRLAVHVGGVFSLDQVIDAHRLLETRQAMGKLVMRLG